MPKKMPSKSKSCDNKITLPKRKYSNFKTVNANSPLAGQGQIVYSGLNKQQMASMPHATQQIWQQGGQMSNSTPNFSHPPTTTSYDNIFAQTGQQTGQNSVNLSMSASYTSLSNSSSMTSSINEGLVLNIEPNAHAQESAFLETDPPKIYQKYGWKKISPKDPSDQPYYFNTITLNSVWQLPKLENNCPPPPIKSTRAKAAKINHSVELANEKNKLNKELVDFFKGCDRKVLDGVVEMVRGSPSQPLRSSTSRKRSNSDSDRIRPKSVKFTPPHEMNVYVDKKLPTLPYDQEIFLLDSGSSVSRSKSANSTNKKPYELWDSKKKINSNVIIEHKYGYQETTLVLEQEREEEWQKLFENFEKLGEGSCLKSEDTSNKCCSHQDQGRQTCLHHHQATKIS